MVTEHALAVNFRVAETKQTFPEPRGMIGGI